MYRLLIVDDEPIIVEGLAELFGGPDFPHLEVHQAFDGKEALDIAARLRMDIVLTDIRMPEMDGIALQREIAKLWPRCRVVFLTGYNDFALVQAAMRGGAVDFVLKTEGDEPIVAALNKAIRSIEEQMTSERLLAQARSSAEAALPLLRKEFLLEILNGEKKGVQERRKRFAELRIPLDPDRAVHIAIGRVDRWPEDMPDSDKPLLLFAIDNILGEHIGGRLNTTQITVEQHRIVWLCQENPLSSESPEDPRGAHTFLKGTLESVQAACKMYLKLPCSFVLSEEAYEWETLPLKYDRLQLLFERGLGLGSEMLLTDERVFAAGRRGERPGLRRVRLLERYLASMERERFFEVFREVVEEVGDPKTLQTGLALEVFYELAAMLITALNRLELFHTVSERVNLGKLLSIREHGTWPEAAEFLRRTAELIFEYGSEENEQETHEVVRTLRQYIEANLDGDLSLTRLSDVVHLTPFYVSRLFKMYTGKSLSDEIAERRIERAKRLLAETHLKIHEVGARIGYDSAPYFTRFFKKMTSLTPQEYRDLLKKI